MRVSNLVSLPVGFAGVAGLRVGPRACRAGGRPLWGAAAVHQSHPLQVADAHLGPPSPRPRPRLRWPPRPPGTQRADVPTARPLAACCFPG
eukprot:scaffold179400_cov22-Prasinocladus_malaysianus.AAC.1